MVPALVAIGIPHVGYERIPGAALEGVPPRPLLGDPRILIWDVMNEPSSMGMPKLAKGDPEFAYNFARDMADYVREIDRTHPATIGVGNHSHMAALGKLAEENGFFSSTYVPTTDEMLGKWKN